MFAKYRPGYRWYYLENQRPDEVCLFKNFDSREESPGKSEFLLSQFSFRHSCRVQSKAAFICCYSVLDPN